MLKTVLCWVMVLVVVVGGGLQDDEARPALSGAESCNPVESNHLFSLRHFKAFWVVGGSMRKGCR